MLNVSGGMGDPRSRVSSPTRFSLDEKRLASLYFQLM